MKKIYFSLLVFLPVVALGHTGEVNESYGHMMDWPNGGGMMGGGVFGFFFFLSWLVWLAVGMLALVWLWQKINKK